MLRSLPVLIILILLALMGWGLLNTHANKQNTTPSTEISRSAPPLALEGLSDFSAPPSLQSLRGQVVILNFFASWCTPCLIEHPLTKRLSEKHFVYGIVWKDREDSAANWLQKHGNPYRAVGLDNQSKTAISYGVTAVPETFLIDKKGRIRHHIQGPLSEEIVTNILLPKIAELETE